jgi:hypothetical protein
MLKNVERKQSRAHTDSQIHEVGEGSHDGTRGGEGARASLMWLGSSLLCNCRYRTRRSSLDLRRDVAYSNIMPAPTTS